MIKLTNMSETCYLFTLFHNRWLNSKLSRSVSNTPVDTFSPFVFSVHDCVGDDFGSHRPFR